MLKPLILKELQTHILGMRFLFAFVIILFIMLGSTSVLVTDFKESMLDYQANQTGSRHMLRDVRHWWHLQWTGVQLVRPISPLKTVVTGTERTQDHTATVYDKARPLIRFHGALEKNPLLVMFPAVDIMFIAGVVLSLITLVLSFDTISGEREDGTLKLLLSFPVPRSTLILAKWLGGFITLSLPFLVGYLCIALWFQLSSAIQLSLTEWGAFLMIGLASLLYIAWMFSASLLVSCWCRRSATAMSVLLFLWVVTVLIIPNITPHLSAVASPVDSMQSVRFKGLKAAKEIQSKEDEALRALEKKYKISRWWRHDKAWLEGVDITSESHNEQREATRVFVDSRAAQLEEQTERARGLGRISPLASYAHIVTTLAWTGVDFQRHLTLLMREYEDRIRRIGTESMKDGTPFTPERIPYFNYKMPSLGQRFNKTVLDWAVLLSSTVVLFLAAFVSFVKRDVI